MDELDHDQFIERLKTHFTNIVSHAQAPHCGYHYVTFKFTSDHELRKALKATKWTDCHPSVLLDKDEIVYAFAFPLGRSVGNFLKNLEGESTYVDLVHMNYEDRKALLNKFCSKCGAEKELAREHFCRFQ